MAKKTVQTGEDSPAEEIVIPPSVIEILIELIGSLLKRALSMPVQQAMHGIGELESHNEYVASLQKQLEVLKTLQA